MRARAAVRMVLAAACVGMVVGAVACVSSAERGPDPNQYLTPIAQARAADVPVYWLGKDFSAGGHDFPAVEGAFPSGVKGAELQGAEIRYFSTGTFWGELQLSTYTKIAWAKVAGKFVDVGSSTHGATARHVTIAGKTGVLYAAPLGNRPNNGFELVLDAGDAVVFAQTGAIGSALDHATKTPSTCVLPTPNPGVFAPSCPVAAPQTPGPDLNPLIDEATFLSVLANLRPYPQ